MTDLNTNQYIQNKLYAQSRNVQSQNSQGQNQNQPNYGDNSSIAGIKYDDKKLDPIKGNLTANPLGKVAEGVTESKKENNFIKIPMLLALGAIPTFLIDIACKKIIKGEGFDGTLLGKTVNGIDKVSNAITSKVPILKFDWAKKAFGKVRESKGIVGQLLRAKPIKPGIGMVRDMIMPQHEGVVKEMLDEALEIAKSNSNLGDDVLKNIQSLKHGIDNGVKGVSSNAYKEALNLAGKNQTTKFLSLKNRADSLYKVGKRSPLSRLLVHGYNSVARIFNLGKFGPGAMGKIMPLFGFAMSAYFLGETVKKTIDAPKEEKGSTLAHGIIVDFIGGWLLFDPLARFMYKTLGGLNNVKGKGIGKVITKPMNWTGKLLSIGLKKGAPIPKATTAVGKVANGFRHTGRFLKGFGGGASRFALLLFVLFPVVDKITRGITHSIFGRPEALLAKEKAEEGHTETAENTEKANIDALNKALEQNKTGMLTVDSKNQNVTNTPDNNNTPASENYLQSKNIFREPNSNPNLNPDQNMLAKQVYMPSDTRKGSLEDQKEKEKFYATLDKTDRVIKNVENTLAST